MGRESVRPPPWYNLQHPQPKWLLLPKLKGGIGELSPVVEGGGVDGILGVERHISRGLN